MGSGKWSGQWQVELAVASGVGSGEWSGQWQVDWAVASGVGNGISTAVAITMNASDMPLATCLLPVAT